MPNPTGHVFWLTGLSGAGKSTLATALTTALRAAGVPVLALDGDTLRSGLCRGLGFAAEDRAENLRRAAEVARLAVDSDLCVVASFITPLESNRIQIREIVGAGRLSLVFVDAPLAVCQQRDVKGLYSRAGHGAVPQMTGISAPYEPPARADLVLATSEEPPAASADKLATFALGRVRPAHT